MEVYDNPPTKQDVPYVLARKAISTHGVIRSYDLRLGSRVRYAPLFLALPGQWIYRIRPEQAQVDATGTPAGLAVACEIRIGEQVRRNILWLIAYPSRKT